MTAVIEPDKKKHNFTFWRFHSISCCRPPPIIQVQSTKLAALGIILTTQGWPVCLTTLDNHQLVCSEGATLFKRLRIGDKGGCNPVISPSAALPIFYFRFKRFDWAGLKPRTLLIQAFLLFWRINLAASNVGLSKITFSWLRVSWWQPLCVPDLVFSLPRPLISCVLSSALSALSALL